MDLKGILRDLFIEALPFLRIAWTISILIGIGLFVLALILKRSPERKISPWIFGILGILAIVSSSTQLIYSWFLF